MQILLKILLIICCFFCVELNAADLFFKPALTIEYSAPNISADNINDKFQTETLEVQLKNFDNIALGANFQIHQNLAFNINWSQTELYNEYGLQNFAVSNKPRFNLDFYNISALTILPIEKDLFDLFFEAGISDMRSSLTFTETNNNSQKFKDHQTNLFFGLGFLISPFDNQDNIRFSALKYVDKIAIIDSELTVFRIGYVKKF